MAYGSGKKPMESFLNAPCLQNHPPHDSGKPGKSNSLSVLMRYWALIVFAAVVVASHGLGQLAPIEGAEPKKVPASSWPQWRGPKRDGLVAGTTWPQSLDEGHLTMQWRVEIAEGYSGPIVSPDRVYTFETKDRRQEIVRAFEKKTGKEVWSSESVGSMRVPFFAAKNGSWVRSTPSIDGERLYVGGMRDVLFCLNARTGKEIWRVDFVKKYGTPLPSFGFVSSPLVMGDYVYVQAAASFLKLDKKTGKVVWRVLKDSGGMWGSAFSSPYPAKLAGKAQILVQTRALLASVDAKDGTVLWSHPIKAYRGMNILTPTIFGNRVFTSSYGGGSLLVNISNKPEGKLASDVVWKNRIQGYMCTPVVLSGHAYLLLRNKQLTCIDLSTGKETWPERQRFGQYMSLVSDGKVILGLDQKGELILFKANPKKFELISRRKIAKQQTWGHIAVAGNQLFIRELKAISCWQWETPAKKP